MSTKSSPAVSRAAEPRWWVKGDWNGLFGLGTNVLLNVIVLTGLCLAVVQIPNDTVYGRILPALGIVAVVSLTMTLIFTLLLASGIRFVSAGRVHARAGQSGSAPLALGYALLAGAGLLVLVGIYLIVPQFR